MNPYTAEFIGTTFLILLGNGVVANVILTGTKGNGSGWIVITTGWALAVFTGVVIAGPYSGAHLNPAVTIALAIAGKFAWTDVLPFILAQLIGAMVGSSMIWIVYKKHFDHTEDKQLKFAVFATAPAIKNSFTNLVSEIVGTFVLIFTIFHFAEGALGPEKTPIGLGSLGAVPVTFLVWAIGLSLGGTTGYAINPARDLGPRIMHSILPIAGKGTSNWNYSWIPLLGPFLGSILAALLFVFFKI